MKEEEEIYKREDIKALYSSSHITPPEVTELSLRQCVYLLSVLSHSVSEDLVVCHPYKRMQTSLTPEHKFTHEIVMALRDNKLLAVSNTSDPEAFVYDTDGELLYYPAKVDWLVLPNLPQSERNTYIKNVRKWLEEMSSDESSLQEANELWIDIVEAEAIEYYCHKTSEIGYSLEKVGAKTREVMRSLSTEIPLSRIYHVIFSAVKNTLHFIESRGIPKYKAKNMFIGGIERTFERYDANGWLKDFGRDFNCNQTPVSAVFFNKVQGLGDRYFTSFPPTLM